MTKKPDEQKTQAGTPEDQAFAWLTLLILGEATVDELEALARWRAQSPLNEAALVEAGKLWRFVKPVVATVARPHQGPAAAVTPARPSRMNPRMARRAVLGGALAASAAYLVVRPPFGLWPSLSEITSDYRTGAGQQRRITTASGATIELNTRTSVDIRPVADNIERIELIAGEAAISTAAYASRSIEAIAGNGHATASDATFNMRAAESSVCVTCVAGEILVKLRGQAVTLRQREQVTYTDRELRAIVEVDPAGVTSWQQGVLIFHDEPLDRVVEEVNRYWTGRIIVANADLAKRLVTARVKLDHLDDAITQIGLVFHANVTRLPGGIVVLRA